jgi:hypothetical protein
MRSFLPALAVALATSFASCNTLAYGLCDLIGCPRQDCGCCCEADCCCEPECCCEPCGDCCCETSGSEPSCGCCGEGCCGGQQFAGQTYDCECESHVPWCPCTGPECCHTCCEPSCECGACCESCCTEPCCGCDSCCECGECCEPCCPPHQECCAKHFGFGQLCWEVVDTVSCCCGCGGGCGCSSEVYWSEWHNDPPRCCDPCDCYGNWTGPSANSYRAPYAHAYAPQGYSGDGYAATRHPSQQYAPATGYARSSVKSGSYANSNVKRSAPRQHTVARQIQPAQAKTPVARNRGAAAVVIRR